MMTRLDLLNHIRNYTPFCEQEEADKILILDWITKNENAFLRENTIAHITASAWVVNKAEARFLWSTTIFTIPGPGLGAMLMGRQICCQWQSVKRKKKQESIMCALYQKRFFLWKLLL